MSLIHLSQIRGGMALKKAVEQMTGVETVVVKFTPTDGQTEFQVVKKPIPGNYFINIGGAVYPSESGAFTLDVNTGKVEWLFTLENGGLDLESDMVLTLTYPSTGEEYSQTPDPTEPEPVDPEPVDPEPTPSNDWEYEFTQTVGEFGKHHLTERTVSIEDVYGPAFDGVDRKVRLYFLGTVANPLSEGTRQEVPLDGIDQGTVPANAAGAWSYDPDVAGQQYINFSGFGTEDGLYVLAYTE